MTSNIQTAMEAHNRSHTDIYTQMPSAFKGGPRGVLMRSVGPSRYSAAFRSRCSVGAAINLVRELETTLFNKYI